MRGLREFSYALERALRIVNDELHRVEVKAFNDTYDANARRRGQYDDMAESDGT